MQWCVGQGKCELVDGMPMCQCWQGYTGERCLYSTADSVPVQCDRLQCRNGGSCRHTAGEVSAHTQEDPASGVAPHLMDRDAHKRWIICLLAAAILSLHHPNSYDPLCYRTSPLSVTLWDDLYDLMFGGVGLMEMLLYLRKLPSLFTHFFDTLRGKKVLAVF